MTDKLIPINDVYIDPTKVISAWMISNGNFMYSVDQGSWSQQFEVETDEAGGWTLDGFAQVVNEAAR